MLCKEWLPGLQLFCDKDTFRNPRKEHIGINYPRNLILQPTLWKTAFWLTELYSNGKRHDN